jgi:hypothetical protein
VCWGYATHGWGGARTIGAKIKKVEDLANIANDITFDSGNTNDYFFQTRGPVTNGTIVLRNSRNSTGTITINITGRTNVQFDPH